MRLAHWGLVSAPHFNLAAKVKICDIRARDGCQHSGKRQSEHFIASH